MQKKDKVLAGGIGAGIGGTLIAFLQSDAFQRFLKIIEGLIS